MRCSPLSRALVRGWHQKSKFRCLSVSCLSFTLVQMCHSLSFRWHYVRSVRLDFTVYCFSLFGYFVGAVSFVLLAF
ncbi:hypothetical protein EFT81_25115 [Vibrio parahaemolyticus]|nr:hypothetical protein [Vibrio parahaemolyticus]